MKKLISNFKQDKLNREEQYRFLSYLEQSLDNGISLANCIKLMPAMWPQKAKLFTKLETNLNRGGKFTEALLELGFSATIVSQIELAMQHGKLVDCLHQLTVLISLKNEQIKKIKAELSYPMVLAGMLIFLLVFMQTFISDQFAASNEHTGDVIILALLCLCLVGLYFFVHILTLLKKQDYQAMKQLDRYPVIGKLVRNYSYYILVYDLWLLLASGFSLQKICQFACEQPPASLQYQLGQRIAAALKAGQQLQTIIKTEIFLPNSLLLLLDTGNDRQALSKNCFLLGRSYFMSLSNRINKVIVNIQPVCFILIGLCIIGMYLKLLLPMYGMLQTI
jgi:competence protein ComGB